MAQRMPVPYMYLRETETAKVLRGEARHQLIFELI